MCTLVKSQKEVLWENKETFTLAELTKLANTLMSQTWVVNGKEFNLFERGWTFGYNNRKRSLGVCKSTKRIELSKALARLNGNNPREWEDVVRHEIAHAIDYATRGVSDHGYRWKSICVQVGANPQRLYKGELSKPQPKYILECNCCGYIIKRYRKPKRKSSCGKCTPNYFDPSKIMELKQLR